MHSRRHDAGSPSMCLIAFAWNAHPRWRLLLAGNRD
jgi:hypothetical protein